MPDYEKMYLDLFRASEEALDILIAAQRRGIIPRSFRFCQKNLATGEVFSYKTKVSR